MKLIFSSTSSSLSPFLLCKMTEFYACFIFIVILQTIFVQSAGQKTLTFSSTQVTSTSCTSSKSSLNSKSINSCRTRTSRDVFDSSNDISRAKQGFVEDDPNSNDITQNEIASPANKSGTPSTIPANNSGTPSSIPANNSITPSTIPANNTGTPTVFPANNSGTPSTFPANNNGTPTVFPVNDNETQYGQGPVPATDPSIDNYRNTSSLTLPKGRRRKPLVLSKIIIALTVCIVAMVALSLLAKYVLRRWNLRELFDHKFDQNLESFLENNEGQAPKRYSYSEIKKITKNFEKKLGRGGFGSVYKGTLPDGLTFVAVKVLAERTSGDGEEFINEVLSISRTSHVNIVRLLGFCYERKKKALVYEFMENKSLDNFFDNNGDSLLDSKTLFKIALGVARGLEYLHRGCNTKIVHFDIKPQNILLDHEFWPKISDFGLAKRCKLKQSILTSVIGQRGTIGFIAPELVNKQFGKISNRSDVYSYGMLILGIAGTKNGDGNGTIGSGESEKFFSDLIYEQIVPNEMSIIDLDTVMNREERVITRKLLMVGVWCIQAIPLHRPTMSRVVEMLEGSLESVPVPPKPSLEVCWEDQSVGDVDEFEEKLAIVATNVAS